MRIVSSAEMRAAEECAAQHGLSFDAMMERAGLAVADVVGAHVEPGQGAVVVLVGPGNNGGDGLVAARYLLQHGYKVYCYALPRNIPDDLNAGRLAALGVVPTCVADDPDLAVLGQMLSECSAVIDALFGTGLHSPLHGEAPRVLERVAVHMSTYAISRKSTSSLIPRTREFRPLVFAVDVPSGLDADSGEVDAHTVQADFTITFGCPKRGHFLFPGAAMVGVLEIADIGLGTEPVSAGSIEVATPTLVRGWMPQRPFTANKGTFGSALVVGGSLSYSGAPRLAAEAAYRAGAGLVSLAIPSGIYTSVAAQLPDTTFHVLPGDSHIITSQARELVGALERYSAILIGPGMGTDEQTGTFVKDLLSEGARTAPEQDASPLPPAVIDADGLNLLSRIPSWWEILPADCILTPHPGEMARLCGRSVQQVQADRWQLAREMASKWRCTVVLKGAFTVCASAQGELTVIPFANPLLATAGTGDVLAGAIAGLLAQRIPAYHAAVCGAYLHGLAGESRRLALGPAGMLAHELPLLIAQAANAVRQA